MEKKISVVIPNHNGRGILLKNLPSVVSNCSSAEIIVVDDASTDDSVNLIHKKFKNVKVIRLRKNKGFAIAVNTGVKAAQNQIVLLLNSDVSPRKNFLKPALRYLTSSEKIFAVGLCDYSHENGRIIKKGRGGGYFTKGLFFHYAANLERGLTLWASGGSSLVRKKIFLKLGGFDDIYKPFYWEDVDLGFRAAREGYYSYFEPLSAVDHYHEQGAILKQKSEYFIKSVSYKNQFIFVWKNIDDYLLIIQHIVFLPYHFAKALLSLNLPFFIGFFWAITSLPILVLQVTFTTNSFIISEKEVLRTFEKQ
jgi:GT2 family glycosyltransferase